MKLTRTEGYRRAEGKEQAGIDLARAFLDDMVGIHCGDVEGDENRTHGDLLAPSGDTIEVKRQPIDPLKYPANFIEIMEDMTRDPKPRHERGFARTAEILSMAPSLLAKLQVSSNGKTSRLGMLSHASASMESMTRAKFVIYANPDLEVISMYSSMALLRDVRKNARRKLVRGAGNSNEDTIATFVPNSHASFRRVDGEWQNYGGMYRKSMVSSFLAKHLT